MINTGRCSKGISVVFSIPSLMSKVDFDESMCEDCGQPLFLTVEECKAFIEKKLQNGFIVCSCCGTEQKVEQEAK
jgi:RNase P subunit RPR2